MMEKILHLEKLEYKLKEKLLFFFKYAAKSFGKQTLAKILAKSTLASV